MVDLEAASIADVREFHETYYVPENATVVIVGDFDAAQTLSMVNQYFARVPKAKRPVPRVCRRSRRRRRNAAPSSRKRGRCPLSSWRNITYDGHPDAYPLHIAARSCRMGRARVFRASWSTTSGSR